MRRAPLTYAYPFLGLAFAINLLAAGLIFDETIRLQHICGVGIIILGVLVMGTGTRRAAPSRN